MKFENRKKGKLLNLRTFLLLKNNIVFYTYFYFIILRMLPIFLATFLTASRAFCKFSVK